MNKNAPSIESVNGRKIIEYWLSILSKDDSEKAQSTVGKLKAAYKALLEEENLPALLLQLFGQRERSQKQNLTSDELKNILSSHCAMVSRGDIGETPIVFPLDPSQRLAVHRFLHLKDTGAIAVNGAPGTGKTDMLRAVISSLWTLSAINRNKCPIVLICGATNQSVENVMHSFDGAVDFSEEVNLRSRWIEGIRDYAVSSPASTKRENHENLYQVVSFGGKEGTKYTGKADSLSDLEKSSIPALTLYFTRCMEQTFVINNCVGFPKLSSLIEPKDKNTCVKLRRRAITAHNQNKAGATKGIIKIGQAKKILKECIDFLYILLKKLRDEQDDLRRKLQEGLFTGIFLNKPLIEGVRHLSSQFPNHAGVNLAIGKLEKATEQSTESYLEAVEGVIDVLLRPACFNLAARYWEACWIEELGQSIKMSPEEERIHHLRRNAMLFPCLVSTLHIAPRLLSIWRPDQPIQLFSQIDMLVVDESGQAAPSIAGAVLAMARKLLVVGDLKQLAPVSSITAKDDDALLQKLSANKLRWEERGITEIDGSVMKFVRTGASYSEPNRQGIILRNHYRCVETIIGYCIELLYHDHDYDKFGTILKQELQPQVKDVPLVPWEDTTGKGFPLHPMSFVQCGSVNDEPTKENQQSWTNKGEAEKIIQWLATQGKSLILWYEKIKGKTVDITDIIAILTPFVGQANLLRDFIKERLDTEFPLLNDQPLSQRLVIGTVHTMQGAERDVILFSGVSKECTATSKEDDDNKKVFLDRDGGNLLNVAVSRAKKAFILFGHADLFFSPQAMFEQNDLPTALLGRYMVKHGFKIAPKALVIVESPLKAKAIQEYLPDEFEVYGTGGHIRDLANLDLYPENSFCPEWELSQEKTRVNLQRTMTRLLQTPYLILATDPDPQGEAIAWHVLQVLQQHPWFSHIKVISRVVFSSVTENEIRSVFKNPRKIVELKDGIQPETVLNENLVNAALALSILDGTIGGYYGDRYKMGMGRVRSAVLHLLASTKAESYILDIVLESKDDRSFFRAKLIDLSDDKDNGEKRFSTREQAEKLTQSVNNYDRPLPNFEYLEETIEIIEPPKPLGTAETIALAWQRYKFSPQKTMALMQELYMGKSEEAQESQQKKEKESLIEVNKYGVLELTEAGWDKVRHLNKHEPSLSSLETTEALERESNEIAQGNTTYKEFFSRWSENIFNKCPRSQPNPVGNFNETELWESFPETLPSSLHTRLGNYEEFEAFLSSIEITETVESRASQASSMGGTLAHPPLMPLSFEDSPPENLSEDALRLYNMIYQHTLATVGQEALIRLQNILYISTDGKTGILVQVAAEIVEEGYFALYPEAKNDINQLFAPSDFLNNLENYYIKVAGIRSSDYSTFTPENTLRLMQRKSIGRPSTYADHFRRLTSI